MIAKRALVLAVVLVLLLLGALTGAAAGQDADDEGEIPEQAVRDLLDDSGRMFTTDDRLAQVAREHEGGFGGYYLDKDDRGRAYVFMLNPDNRGAAEAAFRAAYRGKREIDTIVPAQGDYAFDQLVEWFYTLDHALVQQGVHPGTGAVMEIANRIVFGLDDLAQVEDAHRIMKELGIPEDAVIFEQAHTELLGQVPVPGPKWVAWIKAVQW